MDTLPRTKMHRHAVKGMDSVIHDHLDRENDMVMGLAAHWHREIEGSERAEWDFEGEGTKALLEEVKEYEEKQWDSSVVQLTPANGWSSPSEVGYLIKGFLLYLALAAMCLIWWVGAWTILFEWILGR